MTDEQYEKNQQRVLSEIKKFLRSATDEQLGRVAQVLLDHDNEYSCSCEEISDLNIYKEE